MSHWIWCDIHRQNVILTSAIASVNMSSAGEYHIIFNGSLVNNCIILYRINEDGIGEYLKMMMNFICSLNCKICKCTLNYLLYFLWQIFRYHYFKKLQWWLKSWISFVCMCRFLWHVFRKFKCNIKKYL
jgi:hypothetical protein